MTQAACWSHCRRGFKQAKDSDPAAGAEALTLIVVLYRHEVLTRERTLTGKDELA